jgi:hypothetical protein
VYDKSFDVRRTEMEHPRLMMIDPNDSVIVMLAHGNGPFRSPVAMGAAKMCTQ